MMNVLEYYILCTKKSIGIKTHTKLQKDYTIVPFKHQIRPSRQQPIQHNLQRPSPKWKYS